MKRFSYLLFCLITLPGIAASVREPGRMVNSFMSRAGVGPAPRAKASSSNNGSGGTSATTNAGNGSGAYSRQAGRNQARHCGGCLRIGG